MNEDSLTINFQFPYAEKYIVTQYLMGQWNNYPVPLGYMVEKMIQRDGEEKTPIKSSDIVICA